MPKAKSTRSFTFPTRPDVEVVVKTHSEECPYYAATLRGETNHSKLDRLLTEKCECPKNLYVKGVRDYRPSLGTTDWELATRRAKEWADDHDPDLIEKQAEKRRLAITKQPVSEACAMFLQSKQSQSACRKFRTTQKALLAFLDERNSREAEKILTVDQITTSLLEDEWRPTWFGGKGTYWSKAKRREQVVSFFKYCFENRHWIASNPAKGLQLLKRNKKEVKPTPPFSAAQYDAVLDACALFEASYRDVNTEQLVITNDRLAAFIEVMRWCGCRISDASLMRRDAIQQRDGMWLYVALKNGAECEVPIPDEVMERLNNLPLHPALDDRYYFWSGKSTEQNASDPWQRALMRLWTLCPPVVFEVIDARNKQKIRPSSHMFRNTFSVEARKLGMSYAEIALCIGDDEQTVKDHYSAYCKEYDEAVANKLRQGHRKMPAAGSAKVAVMRKRG